MRRGRCRPLANRSMFFDHRVLREIVLNALSELVFPRRAESAG
jgi:hypothetical protein